jgi:6-phosphogluconolactonase
MRVQRFATASALTARAAEMFISDAAVAIRRSGRFTVALSGGSTPRPLYELLASPHHAGRVDWPRVHRFWSDERCVPPEDAQSNYRMVRHALIERVPLPPGNVHRMRGEDPPAEAAAAYERELRCHLATPAGPPRTAPGRRFDLALLGMGTDGHTASIVPGRAAVRERKRWVVAEKVALVPEWRLTLTPPVLGAAAHVAFLVSGADKAAMLHRVLDGPRKPYLLPAQSIAPADGVLDWLVDADAAARLQRSA